ncbi:hypothetical protein HELRODRAFT_171775 [Helobdella robusta]|uniref:Uncharacterized protein n=1 Tax=Helobdella robusta TaxID=6412 RepID=T1F4N3_HELRO|nr:hypothetical protein HELRODRAFT_171775 [Helobdella robusta]ESO05384.1 hypothetical protein HELRODRAFT_171775 [Helobdella robusta]
MYDNAGEDTPAYKEDSHVEYDFDEQVDIYKADEIHGYEQYIYVRFFLYVCTFIVLYILVCVHAQKFIKLACLKSDSTKKEDDDVEGNCGNRIIRSNVSQKSIMFKKNNHNNFPGTSKNILIDGRAVIVNRQANKFIPLENIYNYESILNVANTENLNTLTLENCLNTTNFKLYFNIGRRKFNMLVLNNFKILILVINEYTKLRWTAHDVGDDCNTDNRNGDFETQKIDNHDNNIKVIGSSMNINDINIRDEKMKTDVSKKQTSTIDFKQNVCNIENESFQSFINMNIKISDTITQTSNSEERTTRNDNNNNDLFSLNIEIFNKTSEINFNKTLLLTRLIIIFKQKLTITFQYTLISITITPKLMQQKNDGNFKKILSDNEGSIKCLEHISSDPTKQSSGYDNSDCEGFNACDHHSPSDSAVKVALDMLFNDIFKILWNF